MNIEDNSLIIFCLIMAVGRVYLELIKFKFEELPLTRKIMAARGQDFGKGIHRFGLYMSIGYIILFAPSFLLS